MLPLSRSLATTLVLACKATATLDPHGSRVDAKGVRMLLVLLSRAARRDFATEGAWRSARYEWPKAKKRLHVPLVVPRKPLCRDFGCVVLASAVAAYGRAALIQATLEGEDGFGFVTPVEVGVRSFAGGPIRRSLHPRTQDLHFRIDETLAAAAHPLADASDDGDPPGFGFDPRPMRFFRCRYSPLLLLRAAAWHDPHTTIPRAWKPRRGKNGDLMLDIPAAEFQAALGVTGLAKPAQVEASVLTPAAADFARVGLALGFEWVRSPKGVAYALRLRLPDPAKAVLPRQVRKVRRLRRALPPQGDGPRPEGLKAIRRTRPRPSHLF